MTITPVIMAGGTGSRLWPMSRVLHPKQFLRLSGKESMLQATALRVNNLTKQSSIVICNEEHRFLAAEQLREINQLGSIILEPVGRNTAPAIALAAFNLAKKDPEAIMLVLAADHMISDQEEFELSVKQATESALQGKMVTFGVVPTHVETGYGYIKRGEQVTSGYKVAQFVEKPCEQVAEQYLESGEHYWNSGMFMFKAIRYLEELRKYRPDIYTACNNAVK
ncbi:mannose-1-phosphate guanylyltransferase, partial [Vibrio parahaemolyticus]